MRSRAPFRPARRAPTARSRNNSPLPSRVRGRRKRGDKVWRTRSGKRSGATRFRSLCRATACWRQAARPAASPHAAGLRPSFACCRSNARARVMHRHFSIPARHWLLRSSRGREGVDMNWISNGVRRKIRNYSVRRDTPESLWIKCPETGQLVFYKDVEANQFVIPGSNYHMRMSAAARLKTMFDNQTWFDIAVPEVPVDPLRFRDERRYVDRLKDARSKTGLNDRVKLGYGKLDGLAAVIAVQDFDFMGGSFGMAAGEAVMKGLDTVVEKGCPFLLFAASGGARMQEG